MSTKTRSTVDVFVEDFNKRHAAMLVKGKLFVLTEIIDPITERNDFTVSSLSDMRSFYKNKPIPVKDDEGNEK